MRAHRSRGGTAEAARAAARAARGTRDRPGGTAAQVLRWALNERSSDRVSGPSRRAAISSRKRACAFWRAFSCRPPRSMDRRLRPRRLEPRLTCALRSSSTAALARSTASAWRSDSRPLVSSARAATCETPSASASSRPVMSCSSDSNSAWRWRGGIFASARSRSADRRPRSTSSSAEAAEPRLSPVHGMKRTILRRRSSSSAVRPAIWYSQARARFGSASVSKAR